MPSDTAATCGIAAAMAPVRHLDGTPPACFTDPQCMATHGVNSVNIDDVERGRNIHSHPLTSIKIRYFRIPFGPFVKPPCVTGACFCRVSGRSEAIHPGSGGCDEGEASWLGALKPWNLAGATKFQTSPLNGGILMDFLGDHGFVS